MATPSRVAGAKRHARTAAAAAASSIPCPLLVITSTEIAVPLCETATRSTTRPSSPRRCARAGYAGGRLVFKPATGCAGTTTAAAGAAGGAHGDRKTGCAASAPPPARGAWAAGGVARSRTPKRGSGPGRIVGARRGTPSIRAGSPRDTTKGGWTGPAGGAAAGRTAVTGESAGGLASAPRKMQSTSARRSTPAAVAELRQRVARARPGSAHQAREPTKQWRARLATRAHPAQAPPRPRSLAARSASGHRPAAGSPQRLCGRRETFRSRPERDRFHRCAARHPAERSVRARRRCMECHPFPKRCR